MNIIDKAWRNVKPNTIVNSFWHAGFSIDKDVSTLPTTNELPNEDDNEQFPQLMQEYNFNFQEFTHFHVNLPTSGLMTD